ncbi:MAG TPA: hypothetical protein VF552_11380 [Allosphingosinicella sp.]|jgi:hypothetical protein
MRHALLAILLVAAAETAALACSCIRGPLEPAERQRIAREVANRAVALVEVEAVSAFDPRRGRGERLRVRRTLAGRAPAMVTAERLRQPSSASCDIEFTPGQRATVILYPPEGRAAAGVYALSASCTTHLLADPPFRAAVVQAMQRRR